MFFSLIKNHKNVLKVGVASLLPFWFLNGGAFISMLLQENFSLKADTISNSKQILC